MNDGQLTRYAAIEARLPEGFPRLKANGIYPATNDYTKAWRTGLGPAPNDLERLGFGVLVLRAGRRDREVNLVCTCELGMKDRDFTDPAIDSLLTALESAYPEGAKP